MYTKQTWKIKSTILHNLNLHRRIFTLLINAQVEDLGTFA